MNLNMFESNVRVYKQGIISLDVTFLYNYGVIITQIILKISTPKYNSIYVKHYNCD